MKQWTKLIPKGKRVIVKLHSSKEMTDGGIIIPESAQRPSNTATVIAVGDKCDWAIDGMNVYMPQDAGVEVNVGDQSLFMVFEDLIDGYLE